MQRTVLGRMDEVASGSGKVFRIPGKRVLVINDGGVPKAYKDLCPHAAGSLKYTGSKVVCVRHGAAFDAASGQAQSAPAMGMALEQLDVRLEEGELVLYEEQRASPWTGQF